MKLFFFLIFLKLPFSVLAESFPVIDFRGVGISADQRDARTLTEDKIFFPSSKSPQKASYIFLKLFHQDKEKNHRFLFYHGEELLFMTSLEKIWYLKGYNTHGRWHLRTLLDSGELKGKEKGSILALKPHSPVSLTDNIRIDYAFKMPPIYTLKENSIMNPINGFNSKGCWINTNYDKKYMTALIKTEKNNCSSEIEFQLPVAGYYLFFADFLALFKKEQKQELIFEINGKSFRFFPDPFLKSFRVAPLFALKLEKGRNILRITTKNFGVGELAAIDTFFIYPLIVESEIKPYEWLGLLATFSGFNKSSGNELIQNFKKPFLLKSLSSFNSLDPDKLEANSLYLLSAVEELIRMKRGELIEERVFTNKDYFFWRLQ